MASNSEPSRLGSHQRETLTKILAHPAGHNIEWHDVRSLLEQVGSVEERHDGKFVVTLGSESQVFERPRHKDIDAQQVVDLRRMLVDAGYA